MTTKRTFGSIRKLKSKRYQVRYVGPDGGRYPAPNTFTARAHASKWLSKTEAEISKGTWVAPHLVKAAAVAVAFGDYADAWLANHKDLTARTRSEYRRVLDGTRVAPLRPLDLTAINAGLITKWHGAMPATPSENAHTYALVRTIMGAAVEDEATAVTVNPCQLKNAGSVKRAKIIKVLTDDQIKALAEAIGERMAALVLVSAYCCLRFGELTELRRKDFAEGELRIRRAVTWVDPDQLTDTQRATVTLTGRGGKALKRVPVVGDPKSIAGVRDIPVPGFLKSILATHILAYGEPGDDGLVFPGLGGGHMQHGSLYDAFEGAREAIGRDDLSWHDLRHTGAVVWAQEDATVKELMTLLGHETPTMAIRYQHVAEGRLTTLAERVSQRVLGSRVAEKTPLEISTSASGSLG